MKDIFKGVCMMLTALLTAGVIYPFLHEAGHASAAYLVGADVVDFELFPKPYVACNTGSLDPFNVAVIGSAGIYMPFFISILLRPRAFLLWYSVFSLKAICCLSFFLSALSVLFYENGKPIEGEDVAQILGYLNNGTRFYFLCLLMTTVILLLSISYEHPIEKCMEYFGI